MVSGRGRRRNGLQYTVLSACAVALCTAALFFSANQSASHFGSGGGNEQGRLTLETGVDASPVLQPRAGSGEGVFRVGAHTLPHVVRESSPSGEESSLPPKGEMDSVFPAPDSQRCLTGEANSGHDSAEPDVFRQLRAGRTSKIPPEVRELTERITGDCTNDMQKARAIYDWLTANIRYDSVEWANIVRGGDSYTHDHSPLAVLERGTTVCTGYAGLFDAMCASAGLDSTFLIGNVRGYRGTEDDELVSRVKHAWSAVKIDGEWNLLDATWGAVQEGESPEEASARADYYFLTPPSQMVYDHLPEEETWQLLDDPLPTGRAFSVLPNVKPSFFQNGLKFGYGYTSSLVAPAGKEGQIVLSAPEGVEIAATVCAESAPGNSVQVPVVRQGEAAAIIVPARSPDERTILRIYSRKGENQPYSCSADFLIYGGRLD